MLIDLIRGLVLGAVQGLTEFFPVSSSGHLILVPVLFKWPDQGLAFDTVIHLGTLLALLWFFRLELWSLAKRCVSGSAATRKAAWLFVAKVGIATLPALILAFLFGDMVETTFRHAWLVAVNLVVWGMVLFWADRAAGSRPDSEVEKVSWKQALAVGLAQPLALIPGTSRSGITISAGLFSGLSRQAAARFSFFLSIPVTAAAGAHGLLEVMKHGAGPDGILPLVAGFLAALGFGLFAIRFLLSYVAKRRYDGFVAYRLALALLVLALA